MVDAFKQSLFDDLINAQQEFGCVTMELFVSKDAPNILFFFERWQNQSALAYHFAQPYTKAVLELAETALLHPIEILYLRNV